MLTEIRPASFESAVLRILEERGHDHPLEATNFVIDSTDCADPIYDQDNYLDQAQVEEIIDNILSHRACPSHLAT